MSICGPCRQAADRPRLNFCSVCKRPASVYATEIPIEQQSVVVHKNKLTGTRCLGSTEAPVTGHELCRDRCPCQHRPPGSWNQRPS
jgi:hypothetical protein